MLVDVGENIEKYVQYNLINYKFILDFYRKCHIRIYYYAYVVFVCGRGSKYRTFVNSNTRY